MELLKTMRTNATTSDDDSCLLYIFLQQKTKHRNQIERNIPFYSIVGIFCVLSWLRGMLQLKCFTIHWLNLLCYVLTQLIFKPAISDFEVQEGWFWLLLLLLLVLLLFLLLSFFLFIAVLISTFQFHTVILCDKR